MGFLHQSVLPAQRRPSSRRTRISQLGSEAGKDLGNEDLGNDLRSDGMLWPMYVDEATEFDKVTLKSWNDALDVLLILVSFGLMRVMSPAQ